MSILIVDQYRMAADAYTTVTLPSGETLTEGHYPKVFRLPRPVKEDGRVSFTTVGFVGDPDVFTSWWDTLIEPTQNEDPDASAPYHLNPESVIAPDGGAETHVVMAFENAVLVHSYAEGRWTSRWQFGAVHGFGGAYLPHGDAFETEVRPWYSILIDAIRESRVPGWEVQSLAHVSEEKEAVFFSLEPSETRKRTKAHKRKRRSGRFLRVARQKKANA